MVDTETLISQLSSQGSAPKCMPTPNYLVVRLLVVLVIYAIGMQFVVGIRSDVGMQMSRITYLLEIGLLGALTLTSILASVLAMYPDAYQRPRLLKLPYMAFTLLIAFILVQLLMLTPDARMAIPSVDPKHECTIAIAAISMIPSALILLLLRQGASVRPGQAGVFAVLASSGIACLTLRIAEKNDALMHLLVWHYIPILLFATLGALIGKWLIRW